MTMRRDDLLDEEERAMAGQLTRVAPHGEPSAELDARILAMAECGVAGVAPASARRRPRRWPVWLGAAASLTVVAGLVWQLQPVLEPRHTISYEAPASVAADNDANGKRQPIDYVESAASDAAMPTPPPPPSKPETQNRHAPPPVAEPVSEAEPIANSAPPPPPAPPAPSAALPVVEDAAAQADAAAAKTQAADRDMAQEAPRRPVPATVEASATAAAAPVAARTRQPPALATQAAEVLVIESAPPPHGEDRAGFDARPPLTADTPEVQRNWLTRIRELRDAGSIDDAKLSLTAFVKRNPKAEIPADLKPLLPAKAPPSTEP